MEKVKKVLILGSTGMLGHQVFLQLSNDKQYQVFNLSYRTKLTDRDVICDITDKKAIHKVVQEIRPHVIINCIGVLIKGSNDNPANAIYINAYFPHFLRKIAETISAKVVHISTDCVFSGRSGPYKINDIKDGTDIYAKSKSLGEIITDKHLTLRTSIVGPELKEKGEGLFHWFMTSEGVVSGYTKSIWSGVTTFELAKVINTSIKNHLSGLYQITNNTPITKYELLKLFKKHFPENTPSVEPVPGKAIDKSLLDDNFSQYYVVSSYEKMIKEMKKMMQIYPHLYSQYSI